MSDDGFTTRASTVRNTPRHIVRLYCARTVVRSRFEERGSSIGRWPPPQPRWESWGEVPPGVLSSKSTRAFPRYFVTYGRDKRRESFDHFLNPKRTAAHKLGIERILVLTDPLPPRRLAKSGGGF